MNAVEIEYFTDDPELISLCEFYWATDIDGDFEFTVKEIAEGEGTNTYEITKAVKEASRVYQDVPPCGTCNSRFTANSRAELTAGRSRHLILQNTCRDCLALEREIASNKLEMIGEENRNKLFELIQEEVGNPISSEVLPQDLSLKEAVSLHTLMVVGGDDDLDLIMPMLNFAPHAFPDAAMADDVIGILMNRGLISFAVSKNHTDGFVLNDEGGLSYYPEKVWRAPTFAPSSVSNLQYLSELSSLLEGDNWPAHWIEELEDVVTWVAHADLRSLFVHALEIRDLPRVYGDKTKLTLDVLFDHYSLGQAYSFIYRGAVSAVDYQARSNISGRQASNSAVASISRGVDRARAEKWDIKSYNRPTSRIPESLLANVLFSKVLKIGPQWFHMKRSEILATAPGDTH